VFIVVSDSEKFVLSFTLLDQTRFNSNGRGYPLEDITLIGAKLKYLNARPQERGIKTFRVIMKDGKIYKITL
jgi:hypothetical protein